MAKISTKIKEKTTTSKEFGKKISFILTKDMLKKDRLVSVYIPTKKQDLKEMNSLLFLITLNKNLVRYGENKDTRTYWTLKSTDNKKLLDISKEIDTLLERKKKVMSIEDIAK